MEHMVSDLSPQLDDMISSLSTLDKDNKDVNSFVSLEEAFQDDLNADDNTQEMMIGEDDDSVLDDASHQDLKDHALVKESLLEQAKFSHALCEQIQALEKDDLDLNRELMSSVVALEELIVNYGDLEAVDIFCGLYDVISDEYSPDACGSLLEMMTLIATSERLPILSDRIVDSPEHVTLLIQRQLFDFLSSYETENEKYREDIDAVLHAFESNIAIDDIKLG